MIFLKCLNAKILRIKIKECLGITSRIRDLSHIPTDTEQKQQKKF